jgi:AsmA protein
MKSLIKWLLIAAAVVLVLPVLVGIVASVLIDPNEYKPRIIAAVEDSTRGKLTIDGALEWSFFPSIGVNLNQVKFELPEDNTKPFARLDQVELGIKLLPLFIGRVEAGGLTVDGLKLQLRTDKAGVNNWERITSSKTAPAASAESEASSGASVGPLAIDIAKVAIENADVHYHNAQDGSEYALQNFNFVGSDITADGSQFPLEISFAVDLNDPDMRAEAQIKSKLSADLGAQRYAFEALDADFLLSGEQFSSKKVNLNISSQGELDQATDSENLKRFDLNLAGTLKLAANIQGQQISNKPKLSGKLEVAPFALNNLLEAMGQDTVTFNNADAMESIAFSGDINGPANSLLLNPVKVTLDKTNLQGQMGIRNLDKSDYLFILKGDSINIDDYSAPAAENAETVADSSQANAVLLPLAALRDLLFKAEFSFDNIIASGLKISNFTIKANGNNGLVKLNAVNADLYGGTLRTNGSLDARGESGKLALDTKLAGVAMQPLLTDLSEIDSFTGTANFNLNVRANGKTSTDLQNTLSGPVSFGIDKPVLSGLNVDKLACEAIAKTPGKQLTKTDWAESTQFHRIGGKFQFENGVGRNNDLAATLANMQITGGGVIDLPQEAVDYRVGLRISGDLSEQDPACEINERYRNINWPVRCKGKLSDDPGDMCGIDAEGLTKVASEMLLEEGKRKLADKLFGKKKKDGEKPTEGKGGDDPEDELKRKLLDKLF